VAVTVWALALMLVVFLATAVDAVRRYRRLRPKIKWSWRDALLAFGAAILVQAGLRMFVVEAFKAPSSSMSPTMLIGDHFVINKLARSPLRGDVIVFRHPCEPERDYFSVIAPAATPSDPPSCTSTASRWR
jgi:signal peptidase I